MTIYLIRHGRTEANERHLYCGSTDLPLSEQGREALRQLHYDIPCINFVTSGMKRTEQTLLLLFGDVPHTADPRFREVDFGVFEMRSYAELKDDEAYQTWLSGDNESNIPPEGESGIQMTNRVLEGLSDLTQDTVLITHGGVIAAIMGAHFPGEGKNRYQWQPRPGHGYVLRDGTYETL